MEHTVRPEIFSILSVHGLVAVQAAQKDCHGLLIFDLVLVIQYLIALRCQRKGGCGGMQAKRFTQARFHVRQLSHVLYSDGTLTDNFVNLRLELQIGRRVGHELVEQERQES